MFRPFSFQSLVSHFLASAVLCHMFHLFSCLFLSIPLSFGLTFPFSISAFAYFGLVLVVTFPSIASIPCVPVAWLTFRQLFSSCDSTACRFPCLFSFPRLVFLCILALLVFDRYCLFFSLPFIRCSDSPYVFFCFLFPFLPGVVLFSSLSFSLLFDLCSCRFTVLCVASFFFFLFSLLSSYFLLHLFVLCYFTDILVS